MKRAIRLIVVAAIVLLFGSVKPGIAQEAGQEKPPLKKVMPDGLQQRLAVTPLPPLSHPAVTAPQGTLVIPKSSMAQPAAAAGQLPLAHTNIEVFLPSGLSPFEAPPFPGYGYETPASLACHYNLVTTSASPACNPNSTTVNPTGGSQTIAIVDAFDDPNAPSDLAYFSLQFGVPLTVNQFHVIWATTSGSSCVAVPPDFTGGWEVEESLDIEWAHAMAPAANLYLVEACSNSYNDLFQAVAVATNLVQCGKTEIGSGGVLGTCPSVTGAGMVSMSWGGGEFSSETSLDAFFNQTNVEYFASAGDSPGVSYPCASTFVICAGGTSVRRDNATSGAPFFNFISEAPWVGTGGGISAFEPLPVFQQGGTVGLITDAQVAHCVAVSVTRCVPDVSFDADPYTGVYVYDTFGVDFISSGEWFIVGGTSVSSPALAGIFNVAETSSGFTNSATELAYTYSFRQNTADFTPVSNGMCGPYMGSSEPNGWSFCNGMGVVNGYVGK